MRDLLHKRNLIFLVLTLGGCGGTQSAVENSDETNVEEPSVAVVTPAPEPPSCPFDMDAIREREARVNFILPPSDTAYLRTEVSSRGDGDALRVAFELRDEDGLQEGEERYLCTPAGLSLVSVDAGEASMVFSPPILVVPGGDQMDGMASGTVGVASRSGVRQLDYTYEYSVNDSEATPPLDDLLVNSWIEVNSTLEIHDDDHASQWITTSRWGLADDALICALREQTITHDGARVVRTEEARIVR